MMVLGISRWLHRHGFGIHSPWAYSVLRDVLFESLPYYAFTELQQQFPCRSRRTRRMDEQLFRLHNYAASTPVTLIGHFTDCALMYARRGVECHNNIEPPVDKIVVVEDIHGVGRDVWHDLMTQPDATATFDIGGCRGIAFFNPNLTKQHYRV